MDLQKSIVYAKYGIKNTVYCIYKKEFHCSGGGKYVSTRE